MNTNYFFRKMFSRISGLSVILTLVALVLGFGLTNIRIAFAATTVTDLTPPGGLRLKQGSNLSVVAKIQFDSSQNTQTLTSVKVTFTTANSTSPTWTNGAATSSELANLATDNTSGISLWKETNSISGFQSGGDTIVTLAASPTYGASNTFTITPASAPTLATNDIYYIVLKTKGSGVTNNNAFTVGLGASDITTSASPTISAFTSPTVVVDTAPPTLLGSGPANNSTNVPISAFIGMNFNKSLDPSTLTPSNITMTNVTDGNASVAVGIKPFPIGFNVVVSSAPTYTGGTSFSKLAGTSTGFYQIGTTGTSIFPQPFSGYVAPSVGDIVFFQHDTFPADLGIITNNTLTGGAGTFSINGFSLFGGMQVTKVSAATATGAVSASTTVNAGDLIVINTTANPTTDRYKWHVVTTGVSAAALNGGTLRVDDQGSAPTFASGSSFSTIAPAATATANGSNQIVGGLNFVAGDLVFANVSANADNTGVYNWHIVTSAENISNNAAPSTLRLDNATSAPTFVSSSRISKLTPAVTGAVTDTTTTLNSGDVVFAKATANASNLGAYTFHLVSNGNNGSGGAASSALRFDNATTPLLTGKQYTVTAGTGITDQAGNALSAPVSISFTTGANGGTNNTPPFVISSAPQAGNQNFPLNAPLRVQFSVPMATSGSGSVTNSTNVGLYTGSFGNPGSPVTVTNTYDATTNTVIITPSSPLTANANYILGATASTTSSTTTPLLSPFFLNFHTSATADTTPPTVLGIFPALSTATSGNGVTPLGTPSVSIGFSKDINPATITGSTLTVSGGAVGTVSYNSASRTANFSFTSPLAADTLYTVTVVSGGSGVKDLAGNALAADYVSTFRTNSTADVTAPTVSFGGADNFGVAVTFSKAMKTGSGPNAVDNIANYTLESPIGSSISLAGRTVTYDGPSMTAKISGLTLQNNNTFKVTVSNLAQDISGNLISTSGSPAGNVASGTVANSTATGGNLGPGAGGFQPPTGTQNYTPISVNPLSHMAGASTGYMVQFPAATSVPIGGSIVLTFPTGFDVTNAAASVAGTESFNNNDINGPLPGVVTIASVTANANARTITVVTGGAVSGANAFLKFDLKNIVNTTVPSSTGYTVDIKTKDASGVILETKTSAGFSVGVSGARTLTVTVFNDNGAGGGIAGNNVKDGTEAGISGASIFLYNPNIGGQNGTTNGSGVATFTGLAAGDYTVGVNPASVASAGYSFNSAPQLVTIAGSDVGKSFGMQAAPFTISGTVTGPASTKVDVYAASQNGFVKTTLTLTGGVDAYSLPVSANTNYNVGVGPSIPDSLLQPGAQMIMPTFNFMPPPNLQVSVASANVTGKNFTLTTASNTITGTVTDAQSNSINGAQVFARPISTSSTFTNGSSTGQGTGGQTSTSGAFTLNVIPGVYIVEVFKPGAAPFASKQIVVTNSGNTPSTLLFTSSSSTTLTISGTVKGTDGNPVPYSGVSARKVNSTLDTTPIGGDYSNFVGGPADANGNYTLYVSAGTWQVSAFAPGSGSLGSKTLTVTSTSLTGQNFDASTLSLGTITGSATKSTVGQQGVMVRADGPNGSNNAITDVTGAYSLKVPAGTYTLACFFPGLGDSTSITSVVVTANTTTTGQNCTVATPITITVNLTDGTNPITNGFIDVRNTNGQGNSTNTNTISGINGVYTVSVPPGTYTVRAGSPLYGTIGSTSSVSSTQAITYTASAGVSFAVSGTVTGNGTPLGNAWVSLHGTPTGQTNTINAGGQSASDGTFSLNVPNGAYSIRADKQGYKTGPEARVTVSGAAVTGKTIALTTASRTISGTVTLNGSLVSNAFVDANDGNGGFAVAQTDVNGAYSLAIDNGTWTLRGHSAGYQSAALTVTVASNSPSGQTLILSALPGFTLTPDKQETITPTSGGIFTNTNIGSGFKLNVPANALGTGSNAATLTTKANTNIPTPSNGTVLTKNAVTISATDSSGSPVTSLNSNVTVVVPYDPAALPNGTSESNLVVGTWNTATNQYETLPTTVDTVAHTLTASVPHFSDFVPFVPELGTPAVTIPSGGGALISYIPPTTDSSTSTSTSQTTITTPTTTVSVPAATTSTTSTTNTTTPTVTPTPTVTTTTTYNFGSIVLKQGSKGNGVKELQRFLNKMLKTNTKIDGVLGKNTIALVKKWQKAHGLKPDGLVGAKTKAKMNAEARQN